MTLQFSIGAANWCPRRCGEVRMTRDGYDYAEFEQLADRIASEVFPRHHKFWITNKHSLLKQIVSQKAINNREGIDQVGDLHFIAEAVLVTQAASAVAGLVASLIAIYSTVWTQRDKDSGTLHRLQTTLEKSGLAADESGKIIKLVEAIIK
jgi:hypothetical protein